VREHARDALPSAEAARILLRMRRLALPLVVLLALLLLAPSAFAAPCVAPAAPSAFPANVLAWIAAHHADFTEAAMCVLFVINLMLKLMPLANWVELAEKSPRIAAFVRLLGGLGIQPVTVLQALIDLLRGTASPGTIASAKAFQVSAAKPLIAPPTPKPSPPGNDNAKKG
jgi:hypothetical protein